MLIWMLAVRQLDGDQNTFAVASASEAPAELARKLRWLHSTWNTVPSAPSSSAPSSLGRSRVKLPARNGAMSPSTGRNLRCAATMPW